MTSFSLLRDNLWHQGQTATLTTQSKIFYTFYTSLIHPQLLIFPLCIPTFLSHAPKRFSSCSSSQTSPTLSTIPSASATSRTAPLTPEHGKHVLIREKEKTLLRAEVDQHFLGSGRGSPTLGRSRRRKKLAGHRLQSNLDKIRLLFSTYTQQ